MFFSLWCRLTGGHEWSTRGWSGVAYCDQCGALDFGAPAWPKEFTDAAVAAVVAAHRAGIVEIR